MGDPKERILARRTILMMAAAAAAACRRTSSTQEDSGAPISSNEDLQPTRCLLRNVTTDEERARIQAELDAKNAELAAKNGTPDAGSASDGSRKK